MQRMATDPIRLWGASISFDEAKEPEITACVRELSKSHKLGKFMAHLLRLAFESPEEFGKGKEVLQLIEKMYEYNMTPTRYSYFNQVAKDVEQMKKRVDDVYELAYKTYTLAQMGKHLGLEDKSKNMLMATFLLERQTSELCDKLGISNINHQFLSGKLENTEKKAQDVLEYIIETYDDVIRELKASVVTDISVPAIQVVATASSDNAQGLATTDDNKPLLLNTAEKSKDNDEDYIVLTEKPVNKRQQSESGDGSILIEAPSAEEAQSVRAMLAGLD